MGKWYKVSVIFIFILCAIFSTLNVSDNDTLFHIKIGEEIIEKGFITSDTFSVHNDLNYLPYAYGFDIIVYLIYFCFGFGGIIVLRWLILLLTFFVLFNCLNKLVKNKFTSCVFALFAVVLISSTIKVRPHVVSYLFFIIQLYILISWNKLGYKNKVITLLLGFIFLTNLHTGACFFHLMIVATHGFNFLFTDGKLKLKGIELFKNVEFKKFTQIFCFCVLGMCLNPYFPNNILYGFKTLLDKSMMNILEWQSVPLFSYIGIVFILIFALTVKKLSVKNIRSSIIVVFVMITIMTVKSARFISYFVLLCAYILVLNVELNVEKIKKVLHYKERAISIIIVTIPLSLYLNMLKPFQFDLERTNPVGVKDFILENKVTGKIYNDYNYGSYLLFYDIKVFVDSRADLYSEKFNGKDILKDSLDTYYSKQDIKDIMDKYGLSYAVVDKNAVYYNAYVKNKDYFVTLYEDNSFAFLELVK